MTEHFEPTPEFVALIEKGKQVYDHRTARKLPERAFVLEGKFQADSADDLAWLLRHFADAIDRKEVGIDGCWCSPSSGAVYRYKTNEDMTHDAYFTAIDEWQKQDQEYVITCDDSGH